MNFYIKTHLPFVEIKLRNNNRCTNLSNVLIDTGSGKTIISAEIAINLGLEPSLNDRIYTIRGVGGKEYVYEKNINLIELGKIRVNNFNIQVGAMNYGFKINAILGMDFLLQEEIILDIAKLNLYSNKYTENS